MSHLENSMFDGRLVKANLLQGINQREFLPPKIKAFQETHVKDYL